MVTETAVSPVNDEELRLSAWRGAQMLDEKRPGWWRGIDTERLNILSATHCILGQLDGDYLRGTTALGLGDGDPTRLGFVPDYAVGSHLVLTNAWRELISERRTAAENAVTAMRAT